MRATYSRGIGGVSATRSRACHCFRGKNLGACSTRSLTSLRRHLGLDQMLLYSMMVRRPPALPLKAPVQKSRRLFYKASREEAGQSGAPNKAGPRCPPEHIAAFDFPGRNSRREMSAAAVDRLHVKYGLQFLFAEKQITRGQHLCTIDEMDFTLLQR